MTGRPDLTFQISESDNEVYDVMRDLAQRLGLTELRTSPMTMVSWTAPAPIVETPPPSNPQPSLNAPYKLATRVPTRIQFVGEVNCWVAPDPNSRKLTFTDNREVDIFEERDTELFGKWWCVLHKTLPSGELFELWIPAAYFVLF